MGIGLENKNWDNITQKWRMSQKCRSLRDGEALGSCCKKHYVALFGEKFDPQGKITTSEAAEKYIQEHRKKRIDGDGEEVITTARGKRRRARLDAAKGK